MSIPKANSYHFKYPVLFSIYHPVYGKFQIQIARVPVLIIFSAYGLYRIYKGIKANRKALIYYSIILLGAGVFVNLSLREKTAGMASSYNSIGLGYSKTGDFDRAIETFKKGLNIDPDNAEVYNNLGQAYLYKGMLEEAEINVKKALKTRPNFPQAHNTLGVIYKNKNLLDENLEEYKTAVNRRSNNLHYHINLGIAYARKRSSSPPWKSIKKRKYF